MGRQRLRWRLQAAAPAAKAAAAGDGVVKTLAQVAPCAQHLLRNYRGSAPQGELHCNARTLHSNVEQPLTQPAAFWRACETHRPGFRVVQLSGWQFGSAGGRSCVTDVWIYICMQTFRLMCPLLKLGITHLMRHDPVPRAASMLRISSAAHDAAGNSVSRH